MPEISNRVTQAYSSPIRKLTPFADQAKADGKKVFHLNIGQPDIETPQVAFEKIRKTDIKILKYGSSKGVLSYREKLVDYYQKVCYKKTLQKHIRYYTFSYKDEQYRIHQ